MISFWVKTRNPFKGKVYVKGEYGKSECTTNFANMTGESMREEVGWGRRRGGIGEGSFARDGSDDGYILGSIVQTTIGPGSTRPGGSEGTRGTLGPQGTCPPCPAACGVDEGGESQTVGGGGSQNAGGGDYVSTAATTSAASSEPTTFYFRRYKRQIAPEIEHSPDMAHLTVKLGTCNIKRDRTVRHYPSGNRCNSP